MENIYSLVQLFRNAIEYAKENCETDPLGFFKRFPNGCCGEASCLLGQFLLENGINSYYICRMCFFQDHSGDFQSHAWLQLEDDTIIDITGDQFNTDESLLKYNYPIYIGETDDFHRLFMSESSIRKSVFLDDLQSDNYYIFLELYTKIKKYLQ
ncbi:MAG: hypothetical protein IKL10_07210 [Clostridia bacterium]|nr:hypothetical protein [Clostridia bacterium]